MADTNGDLEQERDKALADGFADQARLLMREYDIWVGDEITALLAKIQALPKSEDPELNTELESLSEELNLIEQSKLPEAKRNLREKCSEIEDGSYSHVMDAYSWIQDGLTRFEIIVRRLISIRVTISRLWD